MEIDSETIKSSSAPPPLPLPLPLPSPPATPQDVSSSATHFEMPGRQTEFKEPHRDSTKLTGRRSDNLTDSSNDLSNDLSNDSSNDTSNDSGASDASFGMVKAAGESVQAIRDKDSQSLVPAQAPVDATPDAQKLALKAASEEISQILPYDWRSFVIPLFFSVAMITANLQHYLRHLFAPVAPLVTLNQYIFFAFLLTLFSVSMKFGSKSQGALTRLFVKKGLSPLTLANLKANKKIAIIVKRWFSASETSDRILGAFSKFSTFLIVIIVLGISPRLLSIFLPISSIHPLKNATFGLMLFGLIASLFVALIAALCNLDIKRIRDSYLSMAQSPELHSVIKANLVETASPTELIDFDAFADIQRWFKRRFSQKSWKKTAFIILLVLAFIYGDGVRILISTITYLTAFISSSAATSAANAGANSSGIAIGGMHLINYLLLALGFGGVLAYFYALLQPTHLRLSADGIDALYKRKKFGKSIKRVPWKDIKALSLVTRSGTTLVGEKELRFEGATSTLLKFKLNCVDSVISREKILQSIENYAPAVKRDAEIIQILQRPAEQSYTDLWLQTLASPPKRDRLKPLVSNSVLQDNRYTIVRALGLGGQGTAYLATDARTKQTVVLKEFILPIYVDMSVRKSALERFENEARILQKLNHGQIVKLSNFFVEDHRGYLALDYIEGADLKKVVESRGKLSEADILPMAIQMCEILHYLHAQTPPVIHRDFTPDNLILQPDGRLMLIDFNVAQQTSATVTGTIVGKQCYLPPEQFQGDPVIQSDIYAMGATIYFLCTGSDPEPISQSRPANVQPDISQGLNMFVANCTTIDPDLRYKNAAECLVDLKLLTGQTE